MPAPAVPRKRPPGARLLAALPALVLFLAQSCGSRTGLKGRTYGPSLEGGAIAGCLGDLDCGLPDLCAPARCVDGACVYAAKVTCDDGDACTEDSCDPETGACTFTPVSLDEDGDGHRGPRPGYAASDSGACGDDCDDTSPLAYPGGTETCDGVDNDCNGVVDDGAGYVPTSLSPLLVSSGAEQAGVGGLAFGDSVFGVTFSAKTDGWHQQFSAFDENGNIVVPSTELTHQNTDAFTGPLAWTGKVFGTAWEDRRDDDFEIYFNRLNSQGEKLAADLRVTNAPNFSLRPDVLWDGAEFIVVWSDRRDGDSSGRIYGQRISVDGKLVGENVPLTPPDADADAPGIAQGVTELGLVYNQPAASGREIVFRTVSPDLSVLGLPVVLSGGDAASSAIVWSGDRYVVAWDTESAFPGPAIYGAAVAADGATLVQARPITDAADFARSEALLPFGDRLLLAWAEYQGSAYVIQTKMIDRSLGELTPKARVTDGTSDAVSPALAIGPTGAVAVAFEGLQTGVFQVYATSLSCSPAGVRN
ncbi:MAG TPA: MopE-related protein [Polyangiaceae bacterium]|nr:MopE-related protein [Polyangiaceae bacterium]